VFATYWITIRVDEGWIRAKVGDGWIRTKVGKESDNGNKSLPEKKIKIRKHE